MKYSVRFFISLSFTIPFLFHTAAAQMPLNGFLNIPFGIKMETAKILLLQKPGVKFVRQCSNNILYFTGLSMGAYKSDTCFITESSRNGRFESSKLVFYSKAELFEELYELHCAKYGTPTSVSSKDSDIVYRWEFPVKGSKYKNSITLKSMSAVDCFMLQYNGMGTLSPGWLKQYSHTTNAAADNF